MEMGLPYLYKNIYSSCLQNDAAQEASLAEANLAFSHV